jgi:hypothetical protein
MSRSRLSFLSRTTGNKIGDSLGGSKVRQAALKLLGNYCSQSGLRLLFVLAEIAKGLVVECEFQCQFDVRRANEAAANAT